MTFEIWVADMKKSNMPVRIGSKTIKNRITYAPTVKFGWTDESGIATDRFARHYEARSAGGTGLIVVEATCICPEGRLDPSQLGLWEDIQIQGHAAIVDACQRHGAVMLVQLHHGGYNTHPKCGVSKGPSVIEWPYFGGTTTTEALSHGEIIGLRDKFIEAAVRAKKAGYDGVQLHGCHSYLLNDFVSPVANRRTDGYGGSTESRARFGCEIIRGIHDACGRDFIVSVRTTVAEPTIEEACAIADEYVKAGADYLQTSTGVTPVIPADIGYPGDLPFNSIVWAGTELHKHMAGRVPVSVVNGIIKPEQANDILERGLADTIDAARALLADPNWAMAVTEGAAYINCRDCKICFWSPIMPHKCPAVAERYKADSDCVDYSE
jgi:2,4-dienoyl-CoA reductase-like NADH-dependent reductase (Old Yellow Enzyme family)